MPIYKIIIYKNYQSTGSMADKLDHKFLLLLYNVIQVISFVPSVRSIIFVEHMVLMRWKNLVISDFRFLINKFLNITSLQDVLKNALQAYMKPIFLHNTHSL